MKSAGIMRGKTRVMHGDIALWDPADPEPFKTIAGDQFLGQEGDTALVRDLSGCVMHVHRGWLAARVDGDDRGAHFAAPGFGEPGHWWGPE
jgi:hypothetical protein